MLKLIAHVAEKQVALTITGESDSEDDPPTATSTPVRSKPTATTQKTTPVISRTMVTGVLNDSTNPGKKKTRPHRPQSLPPNERPSTLKLPFTPQPDIYQPSHLPLCQKPSQHHYPCLMVSPKASNFLRTFSKQYKSALALYRDTEN